jgi:membrane protein
MHSQPSPHEEPAPDGRRGRGGNDHDVGAARVRDISPRGWTDVALRVKDEVREDRLTLIAAGVAFYGFLALFPAIASIISIWGLFADPSAVQQQIGRLADTMPASARDLLTQAATRVAESSPNSLGLGVALSLLLTLWSANRGMKGLVEGVTVAYDQGAERRGFFKLNAVSLALTVGALVMVMVSAALVVALPIALGWLGLSGTYHWLLSVGRWPLLALFVIVGLAIIYRVAPPRHSPKWRWVTPGAAVATALWIAASIGFSYYTANFGSYNKTYGSLAAVAILLVWFFISAFIVLLGAEINSEAEKQTPRDTTAGQRRGVYRAVEQR